MKHFGTALSNQRLAPNGVQGALQKYGKSVFIRPRTNKNGPDFGPGRLNY
jgi:hypothetical protein